MTAITRQAIVIERRFHGPPQSWQGGHTCGLLALAAAMPRLRAPSIPDMLRCGPNRAEG